MNLSKPLQKGKRHDPRCNSFHSLYFYSCVCYSHDVLWFYWNLSFIQLRGNIMQRNNQAFQRAINSGALSFIASNENFVGNFIITDHMDRVNNINGNEYQRARFENIHTKKYIYA